METIALEEIMAYNILSFCENAAELGCPRDKEVDMWFRELSYEEAIGVASKLLDIEERDRARFSEEQNKLEALEHESSIN